MGAHASAISEIRIAFGGGGAADDEHAVLDVFVGWVGDGRVLYIPIAMEPPHEPHLHWAVAALGSVGITNITMEAEPEKLGDALGRFDAVFIGGGNTYSLLHALRSTKADHSLRRFAELGHPVYGGSAGALILGRDIDTARHVDPNDAGLVDTTGLDLALGYAVWCHYVPNDDPFVHDYVNETGTAVLAIPERGGLARTGREIRVLGPEPSKLFENQTSKWLRPDDVIPDEA